MTTEAKPSLGRAVSLLWRAIRLRCPNCGGGGLWRTWFRMKDACPRCGLKLERGEQGYIVGAQMFNLIAAELLFVALYPHDTISHARAIATRSSERATT